MSDIEMLRLCAEATGIKLVPTEDWHERGHLWAYLGEGLTGRYDPLENDAQAMGLVKKFKLDCSWHAQPPDELWEVTTPYAPVRGASVDLNRAICQCVAKGQHLPYDDRPEPDDEPRKPGFTGAEEDDHYADDPRRGQARGLNRKYE